MADVIEMRDNGTTGRMRGKLYRDTMIFEVRDRSTVIRFDLLATLRDGRAVVLERFVETEAKQADGQV